MSRFQDWFCKTFGDYPDVTVDNLTGEKVSEDDAEQDR